MVGPRHRFPLSEALRRAEAYAAAGADGVFVPGLTDERDIGSLVRDLGEIPLNVLLAPARHTYAGLAALGCAGSAAARCCSVPRCTGRWSWRGRSPTRRGARELPSYDHVRSWPRRSARGGNRRHRPALSPRGISIRRDRRSHTPRDQAIPFRAVRRRLVTDGVARGP
ncbi:isocitrate lyase/phosphoenolpyruvate mutase family protein [Streptomyces sp. M19]